MSYWVIVVFLVVALIMGAVAYGCHWLSKHSSYFPDSEATAKFFKSFRNWSIILIIIAGVVLAGLIISWKRD